MINHNKKKSGPCPDPSAWQPDSFDQVIADAIARPDRFRSLELGVGYVAGSAQSIFYRDSGQLLPVENRPAVVWEKLFGLVNGGGMATGAAAGQSSVLDRVGKRYEAFSGRLSGADRQKIEQHRSMVRELETRVAGLINATCTPTGRPSGNVEELTFTQQHDYLRDMVAAAFACDLTRVAGINLGDIPAEELGYPGVAVHDEYAHNVHASQVAQQAMTEWSNFHAQQFASMLAALDAIPEGNGTMLDNTVCLWINEIGDGAHGFERWPCVVAGGSNLGMRLGQYLYYPSDTQVEGWWWDGTKLPTIARPHNKLLTSVQRAFGVTDSNGSLVSHTGIKEAFGTNDAKIDLGGWLPELIA